VRSSAAAVARACTHRVHLAAACGGEEGQSLLVLRQPPLPQGLLARTLRLLRLQHVIRTHARTRTHVVAWVG
jgi:hypothetical protein